MKTMLRPALVLFVVLSAITGLLYPVVVTGIGKGLFPDQAAGSLIEKDGKVFGSVLIGQSFSAPKYFWGRPSATAPMSTNATGSSGSNQGPTNPALVEAVNMASIRRPLASKASAFSVSVRQVFEPPVHRI